MNAVTDPYELLNVSRSATDEELETAYKRARRTAHPDAGGSPEAFTAVQLAYAFIKKRPCPDCEGSGYVKIRTGHFVSKKPCPKCWNT